jgi:hypothetical protein
VIACTHETSELWYHDCQRAGGRTHAIVIGVGDYCAPRRRLFARMKIWDANRPLPQFARLPGAARAAYRFASYLKNEFHDPEGRSLATLRLLLSPVEDEKNLNSEAKPATKLGVGDALQQWARDCDTHDHNLAILYVTGHGVALVDEVSTLFLADAHEHSNVYKGAINLSHIHEVMKERCRAKDQIFIHDCCALRPGAVPAMKNAAGLSVTLSNPDQKTKGNEHSTLIRAARTGTETYALHDQGTLLSRGLLGDYTTKMGEDALLRTAGNFRDNRFGVTSQQLHADMNNKLREILASLKRKDSHFKYDPRYEASITGTQTVSHIAIPEPAPKFDVELQDVLMGRKPPVKVWFLDGKGVEWRGTDDARDGERIPLPAGIYNAWVQGADGHRELHPPFLLERSQVLKVAP